MDRHRSRCGTGNQLRGWPPLSGSQELSETVGICPAGYRFAGRALHPWSWWIWAICLTIAINLTGNPWQLLLIDAAVIAVSYLGRQANNWSRVLKVYLLMGLLVVLIRVFFAIGFSATRTGTTLFTLPSIDLPKWMAGIRIGGPVAGETLVLALCGALQLASIFICLGAAIALANPRRALRATPAALYEISVAVVVALTVAPQLVESITRIHRAQRLRGELGTGVRQMVRIGIPALEDAVNRSLSLAAGMEVRGFGRTNTQQVSPLPLVLLVAACTCLPIGAYLLLANSSASIGIGMVLWGLGCSAVGIKLAGRGVLVTRYRPDPWLGAEWGVVGSGCGIVVGLLILTKTLPAWQVDPYSQLIPSFDPLMLVVAILAVLPAGFIPTTPTPVSTNLQVGAAQLAAPGSEVLRCRLRGQEAPC